MELTVTELANAIGATVIGGRPDTAVDSAASLAEAQENDVAPLTDARYGKFLATTRAAAVILKAGSDFEAPPHGGTALLAVDDPEFAFLAAVELLYPEAREAPAIHPTAVIEDGAELAAEVFVGPHVVVRRGAVVGAGTELHAGAFVGRNVRIGAHCRIHPRVVIYDGAEIGSHVVLHSGAVIGADGFGYKFRGGRHVKVPQVGKVRIGDHVEIGANACIDRAALGETVIGEGSKIDNQVQVGHNTRVGKHVIMCGQTGIGGSCEIHDFAILAASAGIADHVTIGQGAIVLARSGVAKDVAPGTHVFGSPAAEKGQAFREYAALKKLPTLMERIRALEAQVKALARDNESTSNEP